MIESPDAKPRDDTRAPYRRLLFVCVAVGLAISLGVAATGLLQPGPLVALVLNDPLAPLVLVVATLVNLALRFVRWQYFLRRQSVRLPTRQSLRIFLASLGLGFVPLFAGEIAVRGLLVGEGDQRKQLVGWTLALYERLCDVVVLSLFCLPLLFSASHEITPRLAWIFLVPPAVFLFRRGRLFAVGVARLLVGFVDRLVRGGNIVDDPRLTWRLTTGRRTIVGIGLGVLAWGVVCLAAAGVVSRTVGDGFLWQAGPLFAAATLLGGASLVPGGAGVTGLFLGYQLILLGASTEAALASVVAVRTLTFWLSFAVGQLFLAGTAFARRDAKTHFDAVSPVYDAQIPSHVRDLLVGRKTGPMVDTLRGTPTPLGLDIGCGLGWYMEAMRQSGAKIVGFDLSFEQVRAAKKTGARVLRASAAELPFHDQVFDFAYAVNIMHHLPSREHQERAFAEAARVLKPGGVFFLHEINVINPLFRLYMGYIFPLIKRIDEGTELWLRPEALPVPPTLQLERVRFFTFIPDFVPRLVMKLMLPLERWLESSSLQRQSAHYMVALRKPAASGAARLSEGDSQMCVGGGSR